MDYSGDGLNEGSKVVIAAAGDVKRKLCDTLPDIELSSGFFNTKMVSAGNMIIEGKGSVHDLITVLEKQDLDGVGCITIVDDSDFVSKDFSNWLWVTFTRSNPASDIYGLNSETKHKHFSCSIPVIDARIKHHHAAVLER